MLTAECYQQKERQEDMRRPFKFAVVLTAWLLGTLVVTVPSFAADPAKVAGDWTLTIEGPNGTATPSASFKQDGENLTGTYKGRFGESPLKGTIKGNDIKFTTKINPQGQDLELTYTGTVDGDSMKGKASFGGMGDGEFSGKRAQAGTATVASSAAAAPVSKG